MALDIGGTAGVFSVCERMNFLRGLGEHSVFCFLMVLDSKLKQTFDTKDNHIGTSQFT